MNKFLAFATTLYTTIFIATTNVSPAKADYIEDLYRNGVPDGIRDHIDNEFDQEFITSVSQSAVEKFAQRNGWGEARVKLQNWCQKNVSRKKRLSFSSPATAVWRYDQSGNVNCYFRYSKRLGPNGGIMRF